MTVSLIVAAAANDVIGRDGGLPWHLPADLRRFRAVTTGHVVVMGRVTHESIVARLGHPLPGRRSVVVSRTHVPAGTCGGGLVWAGSVERALARAAALTGGTEEFFVIGGASVYAQALASTDRVYLTRIHREVAGDASMPTGWLEGFSLVGREDGAETGSGGPPYSFLDYQRVPT